MCLDAEPWHVIDKSLYGLPGIAFGRALTACDHAIRPGRWAPRRDRVAPVCERAEVAGQLGNCQ
jgi:hypothetical protein